VIPATIRATATASIGRLRASGIPTTPIVNNTRPSRDKFASPSQSTIRPSNNTRAKTEIEPTYMKK